MNCIFSTFFNIRFESENTILNDAETRIFNVAPSSSNNSQVVSTKPDIKNNLPAMRRVYNPLKAATSLPIRNTIDNKMINEENKLNSIIHLNLITSTIYLN